MIRVQTTLANFHCFLYHLKHFLCQITQHILFRWFDNNHCHYAKFQYQDIAVKDLNYNPNYYTLSYTAKHLQAMLAKLEELMKVFKSGLPSRLLSNHCLF